jgi:sugar lactone lactonase YvrE
MRKVYLVVMAVVALALVATAKSQTVETIGGDGKPGFSATELNWPMGIRIGPDGALYFSDRGNCVIRRLDIKTRAITIVAGTGKEGYSGDGGLATAAELGRAREIAFDRTGNLYISDVSHNVIRRVDAKTKIITTIAGTGKAGYSGDGGPALKAEFHTLSSIVFAKDGTLLIGDTGNNRIRRMDLKTGIVDTFAGNGTNETTPDGATIRGTALNSPRTLVVSSAGDVFVALSTSIYKLDLHANRIVHIAGKGGEEQAERDGPGEVLPPATGDAKLLTLSSPKGMAFSPDGTHLYIADTEANRLLRVNLKTNAAETVAGTGERGDDRSGKGHSPGVANSGDGPTLKCKLSRPHALVVGKNNVIYFTDSFANRIRLIH